MVTMICHLNLPKVPSISSVLNHSNFSTDVLLKKMFVTHFFVVFYEGMDGLL